MASSFKTFLFTILLFLLSSESEAKHPFQPHALLLSVSKDAFTHQYITNIKQRTPLVYISLVLDLGGIFLWIDCQEGYISSSYIPAHCGTPSCALAKSQTCGDCFAAPKPGCNSNTCSLFPANLNSATSGEVALDVVSIHSTNGRNPGPVVNVKSFIFTCGSTSLLKGLSEVVSGMAGLGRSLIGMPSLFSAAFSLKRKFAICLPSSTSANGVIFFGDGPYVMLPNIDISTSLIYTPLLTNPNSTAAVYSQGDPSYEYFIGVKSIKVNEKSIKFNSSLLSINLEGYGGTKISTVDPYTVLETSIYKSLTRAFIKQAKLTRVAAVAPFGVCFESKSVASTRVGPAVPSIDLVLQSESVYWRIFGANSMVKVKKGVVCLGFVDGGFNPRTSIVIGGYQLEDNLLQFDLAASKLGFSSSLLSRQTTCSDFNFTSTV